MVTVAILVSLGGDCDSRLRTVHPSCPAYTEALALTGPLRDRLARYYDYHGEFPPDNSAAGLPEPEQLRGQYVQSVQVEDGA